MELREGLKLLDDELETDDDWVENVVGAVFGPVIPAAGGVSELELDDGVEKLEGRVIGAVLGPVLGPVIPAAGDVSELELDEDVEERIVSVVGAVLGPMIPATGVVTEVDDDVEELVDGVSGPVVGPVIPAIGGVTDVELELELRLDEDVETVVEVVVGTVVAELDAESVVPATGGVTEVELETMICELDDEIVEVGVSSEIVRVVVGLDDELVEVEDKLKIVPPMVRVVVGLDEEPAEDELKLRIVPPIVRVVVGLDEGLVEVGDGSSGTGVIAVIWGDSSSLATFFGRLFSSAPSHQPDQDIVQSTTPISPQRTSRTQNCKEKNAGYELRSSHLSKLLSTFATRPI